MLKKTNDVLLNIFQNPPAAAQLWTLSTKLKGDISVFILKQQILKRLALLSILALSPLPLQGTASFSLLFNPQEVDLIREHLEGGGDIDVIIPEVATEALHLSAIMFMDTHNWTIWLNNQIIHAGEFLESLPFEIKNVTPYEVTFQRSSPGRSPQTFKLRAGQS